MRFQIAAPTVAAATESAIPSGTEIASSGAGPGEDHPDGERWKDHDERGRDHDMRQPPLHAGSAAPLENTDRHQLGIG